MFTFKLRLFYRVFITIVLLFLISINDLVLSVSKYRLVIVISFNGFHYTYLNENVTPMLKSLRVRGSSAEKMNNVFPTKTFVNHFSIATGRYAEEHGVIEDGVFDPIANKVVRYSQELFTFNDSVLPIWILNEMAAEDRHSGLMMWPGCEFSYRGITPTFYHASLFNTIDYNDRIDTIMDWILNEFTPVNLVMIYFEEPDRTAHVYGPRSNQVLEQLKYIDETMRYLVTKLEHNGIADFDLIILSDHGVSEINYKRIIPILHILNTSGCDYFDSPTSVSLYPKKDDYDKVYAAVKAESSKNDSHFRVFKKPEIPDEWRYKNSPRVAPLFVLADEGYVFDNVKRALLEFENRYNISYGNDSVFGWHGYVTDCDSMGPFFIAYGTDFKSNHVVEKIDNVDLFPLFANLLGINLTGSTHSGNFSNVELILEPEKQSDDKSKEVPPFAFLLCGIAGAFVGSVSSITIYLTICKVLRKILHILYCLCGVVGAILGIVLIVTIYFKMTNIKIF